MATNAEIAEGLDSARWMLERAIQTSKAEVGQALSSVVLSIANEVDAIELKTLNLAEYDAITEPFRTGTQKNAQLTSALRQLRRSFLRERDIVEAIDSALTVTTKGLVI